MKKRLIIIYLITFCWNFCIGQQTDTCLKSNFKYLYCMSKRPCSENSNLDYHRELINQYQKLITAFPTDLTGSELNQLGKEYYYIKENDSALLYYELASNYVDTFGSYNSNIGTIYFLKGDYEKSYLYFKKAFQIDSTIQDYMNNIASYFGTIGEYNLSIYWSKRSLKLGKFKSSNLEALNSLQISYGYLKKKKKVKYYRKLYNKESKKYVELTENNNCECTKPICILEK